MRRADLVLDQIARERGAQLRRQRQRGILVHRAHHVLAPVRPEEPERLRLAPPAAALRRQPAGDRKSTRLNSSHSQISYAVFCLTTKIATDSAGVGSIGAAALHANRTLTPMQSCAAGARTHCKSAAIDDRSTIAARTSTITFQRN